MDIIILFLVVIFGFIIINKNNEGFSGYYNKPATFARRPNKTIYNRPVNSNTRPVNSNTRPDSHHNPDYIKPDRHHNHYYDGYTNKFWYDYYNGPYYILPNYCCDYNNPYSDCVYNNIYPPCNNYLIGY